MSSVAGFLSTGDEYSPGNYGMLDQAMAVRWVHENVHYFNGDRSKITVFGPGAGAASAGLLAVAPRTAHMVHQVIAEVSVQTRLPPLRRQQELETNLYWLTVVDVASDLMSVCTE